MGYLRQVKAEHQVPSDLLQPIMIPEWKWERIMMDFVNEISSFCSVRTDYSFDKLVKLYIFEIVRLPEKLQEALGTKLHFSIAFNPQTDDQPVRIIQIFKDMLRCPILEFESMWEKHLPLIEFTYNNSF
ncbi:Gag protease polyprotein [Gossypium australe]|uniref:Gag protease polyprotein n=1 Tax=Gossypium australe TaxID=47621 RepID=A0A5B6UYT6_9ROSI|nr:Gag protease polyprotein [Gossypium australe]